MDFKTVDWRFISGINHTREGNRSSFWKTVSLEITKNLSGYIANKKA